MKHVAFDLCHKSTWGKYQSHLDAGVGLSHIFLAAGSYDWAESESTEEFARRTGVRGGRRKPFQTEEAAHSRFKAWTVWLEQSGQCWTKWNSDESTLEGHGSTRSTELPGLSPCRCQGQGRRDQLPEARCPSSLIASQTPKTRSDMY